MGQKGALREEEGCGCLYILYEEGKKRKTKNPARHKRKNAMIKPEKRG